MSSLATRRPRWSTRERSRLVVHPRCSGCDRIGPPPRPPPSCRGSTGWPWPRSPCPSSDWSGSAPCSASSWASGAPRHSLVPRRTTRRSPRPGRDHHRLLHAGHLPGGVDHWAHRHDLVDHPGQVGHRLLRRGAGPAVAAGRSQKADTQCQFDLRTVQVAVTAYWMDNGAYPFLPEPVERVDPEANYARLTSGVDGGPWLDKAPSTDAYVVEYNSAGDVWWPRRGRTKRCTSPARGSTPVPGPAPATSPSAER